PARARDERPRRPPRAGLAGRAARARRRPAPRARRPRRPAAARRRGPLRPRPRAPPPPRGRADRPAQPRAAAGAVMTVLLDMLASPLMQRALIAAVLVGLVAPVRGTYLVQRRLSLLGDGIGHMALTGVAVGWLVGGALGATPHDALAVPGAVVASIIGAVVIELVRERGRTSGDLALALLFYGGIAGGVLLIGVAGGTTANLNGY